MRIALFHNLLSGGAKRTLMELTRRLALRHHVDAFALSCSEHEFADIRPFVSAHVEFAFDPLPLLQSPFGRLNQAIRYADLVRLDRLTRQIAAAIDRGGYDVVFVHPCRFEQSSSVLKHLRRTPSAYYCHEPRRVLYEDTPARPYDDDASGRRRALNRLDPLPAMYRGALRRIERHNTRCADTVLVNSRFMTGTIRNVFQLQAEVAYPGVDVDEFSPGEVARRDFVLSVGSLTPLKGFDFLIRAMAEYEGERRPTLLVASNFQNPPERAYLEQLAASLGVDLELRGNVTDDDLVGLYRQARVVACAPIREPFGLTPIEAMACATPVVAVAEGGLAETVVDGRTGALVPRDPKAFAAAVRRLVEDPALAQRWGENGRSNVVANWSWESVVTPVEGLLKRTAESASRIGSAEPALAR